MAERLSALDRPNEVPEDPLMKNEILLPSDILKFWFIEINPKDQFSGSEKIDALIRERFSEIHAVAKKCELSKWRMTPEGRLAEIIILDQFSRNLFRDDPKSFAQDPQALSLAQEAIALHAHEKLSQFQRNFMFMPYMHSESQKIHQTAEKLFSEKGLENSRTFEIRHKAIIDRFGRFPHRNKILGRQSTLEEVEFLKQPGSSF